MRETFDRELQRLEDDVLVLGSEVEINLIKVTTALVERDMVTAQLMVVADQWVNERRINILLDGLRLIATQQPMARDMRLIGAVLEIVSELERIHDYVKGIGKLSIGLGPEPIPVSFVQSLPEMASIARDMLHRALEAFSRRDAGLAREIPADDDRVDALFNQLYAETIDYVIRSPESIDRANHLEWAIHNLERSADRVINICEWVIYMVDGIYADMNMGEYEAPPSITGIASEK
jgi:phosphate transport system protein